MERARLIAQIAAVIIMAVAASATTMRHVVVLAAQEPVINRSAPMTLTGEIVDISCYKQKGVAGRHRAAHVDCAKAVRARQRARRSAFSATATGCSESGARWPATSTRSCSRSSARRSSITGTEVTLSNNYDVRSFDLQTIKIAKKTPVCSRRWGQTLGLSQEEDYERKVIRRRRARRARGADCGRLDVVSGARRAGARRGSRCQARSPTPSTSRPFFSARARRAIVPAPTRRCRC